MSLEPNFVPELTALVNSAIKANASNLDFSLHKDEVVVNFRVDGDYKRQCGLSLEQKNAILTEIHCKLLGHEKICHDRHEDAVFHLPHEEWQSIRVRLAMTPYGDRSMIFMRLLPIAPSPTPETEAP
jgi:type II secretory ATPase GspE/PulE/Tfp pilus assembly ATPase PilB-like protein